MASMETTTKKGSGKKLLKLLKNYIDPTKNSNGMILGVLTFISKFVRNKNFSNEHKLPS
jgi:hypothetical protein